MNKIESHELMSNGWFTLIKAPFEHKQHPNQQEGLDLYVTVIDHSTGEENTVKLYKNTKGLYFRKRGNWYVKDFTEQVTYVPFQILKRT